MSSLEGLHNSRGVALLIVLLVTALLLALIFEFAYATRVSLRSAVNFRDSQRAYFLARSGMAIFSKFKELQETIPQGEWGVVPIISTGETMVRLRWEDEKGKVNINTVNTTMGWVVEELFSQQKVGSDVLQRVETLRKEGPFKLLSELHKAMPDEDYAKVARFLTVYSDNKININTASEEVLNSILKDNRVAAGMIINSRKKKPIESLGEVGLTQQNTKTEIIANLTTASDSRTVYSFATVGGYTKQIEAVGASYWRVL